MGLLDQTTNNIIIDAVLTDTGRKFLSRNDGSFMIHKFALGDDEVNYSIIRKYGRAVGREKIEKNTPVFEGITNQAHAQKSRLVSVSNPSLVRLPRFELSGDSNVNNASGVVFLGRNQSKTSSVSIEQVITDEFSIDVELRDQVFLIEVNNLFLQVLKSTPENIDSFHKATYLLPRSPVENSFGGSTLQFTIGVKSLTDSLFQVYGSGSNKTKIRSYVKVTGLQSATTKEFAVEIEKNL